MLLFQSNLEDVGGGVLATRYHLFYVCENGHRMHTLLTTKRVKCINPTCSYYNILYVLPIDTVTLVEAVI